MKPTSQFDLKAGNRNNSPLTDYHFQTSQEPANAAGAATRNAPIHRAPWKLSTEFIAAESIRDFATELVFFGVIIALAVWPLVSTLVAVTRMVRNY